LEGEAGSFPVGGGVIGELIRFQGAKTGGRVIGGLGPPVKRRSGGGKTREIDRRCFLQKKKNFNARGKSHSVSVVKTLLEKEGRGRKVCGVCEVYMVR